MLENSLLHRERERKRENGMCVSAVFDVWLCRSSQVPELNDHYIDQHVFYCSPETHIGSCAYTVSQKKGLIHQLGWFFFPKLHLNIKEIIIHYFSLSTCQTFFLSPETNLITPTLLPHPPARQKIGVWPDAKTHTHKTQWPWEIEGQEDEDRQSEPCVITLPVSMASGLSHSMQQKILRAVQPNRPIHVQTLRLSRVKGNICLTDWRDGSEERRGEQRRRGDVLSSAWESAVFFFSA